MEDLPGNHVFDDSRFQDDPNSERFNTNDDPPESH